MSNLVSPTLSIPSTQPDLSEMLESKMSLSYRAKPILNEIQTKNADIPEIDRVLLAFPVKSLETTKLIDRFNEFKKKKTQGFVVKI